MLSLSLSKTKRSATNTRLMRDLSRLMRSDTEKLGFSLQLKNDDALNEWNINLFGFSDCPLADVRCIRTQIIISIPTCLFCLELHLLSRHTGSSSRFYGVVECLVFFLLEKLTATVRSAFVYLVYTKYIKCVVLLCCFFSHFFFV